MHPCVCPSHGSALARPPMVAANAAHNTANPLSRARSVTFIATTSAVVLPSAPFSGSHWILNQLPCGRKLFRTISAVLGIVQQIRIRILSWRKVSQKNQFEFCVCVRGSITYNVTVHVHVLWLACTHRTSIPNVVVSLMINDNISKDICTCICVFACVSMCV